MKKTILITLVLALALSLCACSGGEGGVSVQRADSLTAAGLAGERYAGMVVSENVVEIQRDSSKTIEELYVKVGQEVKAGDKLFTYDSAALELDLEKAKLEVEKMTGEQTTYTDQLAKLEKQLARTYNESSKVRLTLEINTLKTTIMENDYNLASKAEEISKLEEMLQHIDITTPVDGTVRQIDEQGTTGSYITIQQSGAYRIQGVINEMSMGNGLTVGSRVVAHSRVSDETWTGTVVSIDTEASLQNDNNGYYYNIGIADQMASTSNYVFYVELDSVEGLLLGQHIYVELLPPETPAGLWIPETYLMEMTMDEETFQMSASVWAEKNGKLEQRSVSLGGYDPMSGCYEILDGITAEDYLADPMNPESTAGASVSRRDVSDFDVPEVTQSSYDDEIMLPIATYPEGEIITDGEVPAEDVITIEPVDSALNETVG